MISIWEGNTGQGKTYMLGKTTLWMLARNKKWYDKGLTKKPRLLYTNMVLSQKVTEKYKGYIHYWSDLTQLVGIRQADIIFDDMATYLDAQDWIHIPESVKRWLRLHEHYGCDIYGNAQDFNTIYKSVRLLTGRLRRVRKILGSKRPAETKPPVSGIWGVLVWRDVANKDFGKDKEERKEFGMPHVEFLRRKHCEIFDTSQDLESSDWPPLQHIQRVCVECSEMKVIHR